MRRSSTPSPLTSPAVLGAREVTGRGTREPEAVRAIEGREVEVATVPHPRTAEDHIASTGVEAVRVGTGCPDEDVIHPIAIDIPGRAHRVARAVKVRDARELEAVGAVESRELEVAATSHPRAAEDHIACSGALAVRSGVPWCTSSSLLPGIGILYAIRLCLAGQEAGPVAGRSPKPDCRRSPEKP